MKNKKAIIILSAILVIVTTVCCILFIPSNKNKDIANEKENIYKDITPKDYGYDIPDSTEIEIDGTKVKLEDLTSSFKDFPSTLISKANEITYKDKLYMIENSPSDFDHNIIDEEFAKKNEFESVEDAYEVKDFEIDLSSYKTNDSINEPFPTDTLFRPPASDLQKTPFSYNNDINFLRGNKFFYSLQEPAKQKYDLLIS